MTVKEFWAPGSQRDKLIDFYRAIKNRESYVAKPLDDTRFLKVSSLAKELLDDYNTDPSQLKAMLESAQ